MSGHRPRKRFGQHFLHDPAVIQHIVDAIDPAADDIVVEIGPGEGVLTRPLAARCRELHMLEIDRDLVLERQQEFAGQASVTVHETDALAFDICSLAGHGKKLKLAGNLPYNVSTPLLFHCLKALPCIRDMHFMLQKEVVDRLVARPGTKAYGRLSIMTQALCDTESLFDVGPGAFRPPPKVQSSVVRLVPRTEPLIPSDRLPALEQLTQLVFSQRRKTLRKILQGRVSADQLESIGIDPARRPETLSIEEFGKLLDLVSPNAT